MSTVVTGEGVELEVDAATVLPRAVSALIDYLLYLAGYLLCMLVALPLDLDDSATGALAIALGAIWLVLAPALVETLTRGKSLGRLAMGLRIVRDDGGSIRLRHALIRSLSAILEIIATLGTLAIITSLFNERGKRIGDLLAGSYALRERRKAYVPAVLLVPGHLRAWSELADLGRVPDRLAARIARFSRLATGMAPDSRQAMAAALATELHAHVAPSPPAGTSAEDFLASVIAERRSRDFVRLNAQRERSAQISRRLHRLPHQDA